MNTSDLLNTFFLLLGQLPFQITMFVPLVFIALDLITGIGAAIRTRTYDTKMLSDVLKDDALKYLVKFVSVFFVWVGTGQNGMMAFLASGTGFVLITPSLVASIIENCRELFGLTSAQTSVLQELLTHIEQMIAPVQKSVSTLAANQVPVHNSSPMSPAVPINQYALPPLSTGPNMISTFNPTTLTMTYLPPSSTGTTTSVLSNLVSPVPPNTTTVPNTPEEKTVETQATGPLPVPDYYKGDITYPQQKQ